MSNKSHESTKRPQHFLTLGLLALSIGGGFSSTAQAAIDRPPQYVMLAFDGSLSHDMWRNTRAFAQEQKAKGRDVRFTYFLSGVYYLMPRYKSMYTEPARGVGQSAIGWGANSEDDIRGRVDLTNGAYLEGHEMGSHANAHFSGAARWSESQWQLEFKQFKDLIFNVFTNNRLTARTHLPSGLAFSPTNIVGFRAPLLEVSAGLWPTLRSYGFRYDTSKTSSMGYVPEKSSFGQWNFPLASIPVAGTGRRTLSMDYNFYVTQSAGRPDSARSAQYEQQMYDSYINYFMNSYNGGRAPLHIGHHFSMWNGGAYWRAFKRFADTVCGMREVRCVTYKELADHMDGLSAADLQSWKAGRFERSTPVRLPMMSGPPLDVDVRVAGWTQDGRLDIQLTGRDLESQGPVEVRQYINGVRQPTAITRETVQREVESALAARDGSSVAQTELPVISVRLISRLRKDIASSSHTVIPDQSAMLSGASASAWTLDFNRIEDRALLGDLTEAHEVGSEADGDHSH